MSPLELPKINNCANLQQICPKAEGPQKVGSQEGWPVSLEGGTMPQVKFQQTQQGSILEDRRHGPYPCYCLQGQAQNSKQMGKQVACGGMATLPETTSICGVFNRGDEGTAITWTEITCFPSTTIWNRRKVKILWGEMDPVKNQLQYHMRMMHSQLTAQPKVDQKACPNHHHNSVNHFTQGWLGQQAWISQMEGSKLTRMHLFYQGEAQEKWGTNPHRGIGILHYSRITSFPVHSIFGLAYASAFTSSHACTWPSWGIQYENTLLKQYKVYCTNSNYFSFHLTVENWKHSHILEMFPFI